MLDFPDAPSMHDVWPEPLVEGVPQWQWDGAKWNRLPTVGAASSSIPHCGQLVMLGGGAAARFEPFNGDEIRINGQIYQIPLPGTAPIVPSLGLQYVYASVLQPDEVIIEQSTVGHVTDTTPGNEGVKIMQGDPTRTLVGMVHANASQQFVDSPSQRLVASWFNRRSKTLGATFPTPLTIPTGSVNVQLGPTIIEHLWWPDEPFVLFAIGAVQMGSAAGQAVSRFTRGPLGDMPTGSFGDYIPNGQTRAFAIGHQSAIWAMQEGYNIHDLRGYAMFGTAWVHDCAWTGYTRL